MKRKTIVARAIGQQVGHSPAAARVLMLEMLSKSYAEDNLLSVTVDCQPVRVKFRAANCDDVFDFNLFLSAVMPENCPICGEGHVTEHVEKLVHEHNGKAGDVDRHYLICDTCTSDFVDARLAKQNKRYIVKFRKRMDGRKGA